MKGFKKGVSGNPDGRPKGVENRLTRTVKELILETFNTLQNDPKANLLAFAKSNPCEFYKIAARLIPTEIDNNSKITSITIIRE